MKKIITDFSFGEISTKFDGRADLPYYTKGCSELRNMYVMPQGVAGRIGGTEVNRYSVKSDTGMNYEGIIVPFYYDESRKGVVRMLQAKGYSSVEIDFIYGENIIAGSGAFTWAQDLSDVQWAQVNTSSGASIFFTHPNAKPLLLTWNGVTNPVLSNPTFTAGAGEETFSASGHYPSVCGYFAGRLIFGATATNPDMLWMSKTLNPTNFTLGNNDGDAIALHITTSDYNKILWVKPKDEGIVVGTATTETQITGGDNGLTPTSLLQTKISTYGSSHTDPIQIGLSTLFVEGGGRVMRELAYSDENGALHSPDITMLADHLTESGIKRLTYQLEPFEAIFCLRNDSKVAMLTYDRNTGTNAWSLLDLGCEVIDICSVKNDIYFLTKRDYHVYLEKLKPYEDNPRYLMWESDHYINENLRTWDRTIYLSISGGKVLCENLNSGTPRYEHHLSTGDEFMLTHDAPVAPPYEPIGRYAVEKIDAYSFWLKDLEGNYVTAIPEGATVAGVFPYSIQFPIKFEQSNNAFPPWGTELDVFADDKYIGKYTTDNFSNITLPEEAWKVQVGHKFTSHMKTMRLMQDAIGNPVGRINKVYLRLWKSLGCKIGQTMEDSEEITFRDGELDLGTPQLYTGDKEHTMLTEYTTEGHFYVWTDDVYPLNISAMAVDFRAGGQRK